MQEQQEQQEKKELQKILHSYPNWPTSKPGPKATQPPPGMRPMQKRTEQMLEVGYNQETGEPAAPAAARTEPDPSLKGRVSIDQEKSMRETGYTEKKS